MNRFPSILFLLLVVGCGDAPRDNPLDPLSPRYEGEGLLAGSVLLKDIGTPIVSAHLRAIEEGVVVITDSTGRFAFPHLQAGVQTVVCAKDNFAPDTQSVTLVAGSSVSMTFTLNAAPVIQSPKILTRKVDQYFPSPQYFVDVSASIADPNGVVDLDSVWFEAGGVLFPMGYNLSTKQFEVRVFKYDVPTNTIQWFVGQPLHIIARDAAAMVKQSDPFMVSRVIEYGVTPLSPAPGNNDTTNGAPIFRWLPPTVTFNYSFTLTISRVDAGTPTVVWDVGGLSSILETYSYPTSGGVAALSVGSHVWAVTVVDEFGNSCRSKEASFVVQ